MIDRVDALLGRVSMYRVVSLTLGVLAVYMIVLTAVGVYEDPFTVPAELLTLAVLVVASYVASRACGLLWRVRPHGESSLITALLLWFLFWPSTDAADLLWLAGAAVLANLSKYVFAWHGRHFLNPAAAGAFLVLVTQTLVGRDAAIGATWWVAAEYLLPLVAVGTLVVLWRTRRLVVGSVFMVVAWLLLVIGLHDFGNSWGDAAWTALTSYPLVFLAGFMLSEPLTLPPRQWQQLVVATVAGVVFAYPIAIFTLTDSPPDLGVFTITPELSLLVANVAAFALARRTGIRLTVQGRRHVGGDVWEWQLTPARPVRFTPGQYVELHLPHWPADRRGMRRAFSIASGAEEESLAIATRMPDLASTFKTAFGALQPGDIVTATGIQGDFVWPAGPLLLVAGGIGITPFASQLRSDPSRDVVLVFGQGSAGDYPYADDIAALGVPIEYVEGPLTAEKVAERVPDIADRTVLVSGAPAMVHDVRRGLRRRAKRVLTDYFAGY